MKITVRGLRKNLEILRRQVKENRGRGGGGGGGGGGKYNREGRERSGDKNVR